MAPALNRSPVIRCTVRASSSKPPFRPPPLDHPAPGGEALNGPLNILMVGIDERPTGKDVVLADSITILHIPENR